MIVFLDTVIFCYDYVFFFWVLELLTSPFLLNLGMLELSPFMLFVLFYGVRWISAFACFGIPAFEFRFFMFS
jgi:hypothetical protein